MKPIKLVISAFGPYADMMPPIEFEKYEEKGLFLISGDTGAGKTTIFDAICFALYGEASGSYRNKKNLRSEYAKPETESYVDFYFSHQGQQYHICRKPSFERINRRGNVTEEPEKVIFYYEDGTTIEGTRNVDGTKEELGIVRELLHVDVKQFKQIVMIAQGEFRDLLNAKTEERTEILRTIFQTETYKKLESKLKEQMNESYRLRKEGENSILQYFDDVSASDECEAGEELIRLQAQARDSKSVWDVEGILSAIDMIINDDKKRHKDVEKELNQQEELLTREREKLVFAKTNNELLTKISVLKQEKEALEKQQESMEQLSVQLKNRKTATYELSPVYQTWKTKQAELGRTEEELKIAGENRTEAVKEDKEKTAAYEKALKEEPEMEALKQKLTKMLEDEENYALRDSCLQEIELLKKEEKQLDIEEKEILEAEVSLKEKIASLKSEITHLKEMPEKYAAVTRHISDLSNMIEKMQQIFREEIPAYRSHQQELENAQTHYQKVHEVYRKARTEEQQAKDIIDGCRAGILAKDLKEGMACPVCGATHHLKLAELPEQFISEEQYEKLQDSLNQALILHEETVVRAEGAKKTFEAEEKHLIKEIMECLKNELYAKEPSPGEEISSLIAFLHEEKIQLQRDLETANLEEKELKAFCKDLEDTEKMLEQAENQETVNLETRKNIFLEQRKENQKLLVQKEIILEPVKKLPYGNLKKAVEERKKIEEAIQSINDLIHHTREEREEAAKRLAKVKSAADVLEKTEKQQREEEQRLKDRFLQELSKTQFSSEEEFLSYVVSKESVASDEALLQDYESNVKINHTKLETALADGQGKEWIDMEQLQQSVEARTVLVNDLQSKKSMIEYRFTVNQEKYANIKKREKELEKNQRENEIYSRLYYLVTGQTGNGKITLEQYIQAAGFDHIIAAANRRLLPMTDYRYELYRQEDSLGKKSNTFLDLEVLDNFTGHRRPVGNLSGGESFKASLSLALGLSDTVSAHLGGVQMDALFVDEGFGSLDKKSMESAMDILVHLAGTNKLVGIISHREELMENIPQQLKVRKTKQGSEFFVEGVF